jgi:uncharacterized protein
VTPRVREQGRQHAEKTGKSDLGGAFADPVDGAALLFQVKDRSAIEGFVKKDPYVTSGLVTAWRIRPWTVVVGGRSDLQE